MYPCDVFWELISMKMFKFKYIEFRHKISASIQKISISLSKIISSNPRHKPLALHLYTILEIMCVILRVLLKLFIQSVQLCLQGIIM